MNLTLTSDAGLKGDQLDISMINKISTLEDNIHVLTPCSMWSHSLGLRVEPISKV